MEQKPKRVVVKIGDIFCAKIDEEYKVYFQYVCDDLSQLNSRVIRVFSKKYDIDETPKLEDVVQTEIAFYAHVVIKWGIQNGLWSKVGNVKFTDTVDVLFRCSNDFGAKPPVEISYSWRIWRVNEPFNEIGVLSKEYQNAELGPIWPPYEIINRIRTGKYSFPYPRYE